MRQEHNRALAPRWKPASVDQVVFWKRCAHGRSEAQEISVSAAYFLFQREVGYGAGAENLDHSTLQAKVGRLGVGKKLIAGRDDSPVVFPQVAFPIFWNVPWSKAVSARPIPRPLHAPL